MYAQAATSANRGIYIPAHGSGGAKSVVNIDTNNRVWFADSYNGTGTALAYSQSGLGYDSYTWLAGWNGYELRAVHKSQFCRAVNMNGTERNLQIRYGGVTLNYCAHTTVTFSPAFSNACLMVVPINQQEGYGAGQALSVDSISRTSCRMFNWNTAAAACWCGYIAIGY